ncbi:TIGR02391 family protein [Trichormus azollae]|uniref:TIGR02391 family protein n=1 Tax=Trichormus azollae TaxID=1164 RepID=UPI003D348926
MCCSDLSTETLRNEQLGLMMMLQGFVKGVRNVIVHIHGKQEEARKAYEYLFIAYLFCRPIDETTKTKP